MKESLRLIVGLEEGLHYVGTLRARSPADRSPEDEERTRQIFGKALTPNEAVRTIIADVRERGDKAIREWTQRIDGVTMGTLAVSPEDLDSAYESIPIDLRDALHLASDRIRAFHEREPRDSWMQRDADDGALGQLLRPIRSAGVYVPGGCASYPSSLLMAAIPAQVAGVQDILVATPPGPSGMGAQAILAAARVVGLSSMFLVGGAQAIAALAYGTDTVPRVDKVVGAGGRYVTLAKQAVYGDVGIDGLFGPTETMIIADQTANPKLIAADLLAQAEHDTLATALLLALSVETAIAVRDEIGRQISSLKRREIIRQSLERSAAIIIVSDLNDALRLSNEYAPEHLCLAVQDPWRWLDGVRNAGGVFMGEYASEALGHYAVAPSHVMPTAGTARFASPLHVRDFLKVTSVFAPGRPTVDRIAPSAAAIARAEGLTAHAAAIEARLEQPREC